MMYSKINIENIKEIYGDEIIEIMLSNMDIIESNAKILKKLGFNAIEELIEKYPNLFVNFPKQFEEKIEYLRKELGENYIEIIENDINVIEKIDK